MDSEKIKVGITHGDYNGIGYEVILKTFDDPLIFDLCTPVVYGSQRIASFYRKQLELPQIQNIQIDAAADAKDGALNFINVVGDDDQPVPGHSTEAAGRAALAALERAVADLKNGQIDVLVTAPINKANIQGPGFQFPGHTEYLESAIGQEGDHALMILAGESGLRVAPVTIHLPLAEVASSLTTELICRRLIEFNDALIRDFGVHKPRIAVLSLNPHAGDNGLLGKEEEDIIIPAIAEAANSKVLAFGPYPADGFFGSGAYTKFDGVLAMYHDQGLIPFKTIEGASGVNFTSGLPYVRTSPDHGTAYDIAGRGEANPQSMRQAVYMAIDALRQREVYSEIFSNPLKKLYQDRGRDN